tara:strand:+ start:100 stop:522 length:423 start_codon:yes stop_codon:yes gene_type:complete
MKETKYIKNLEDLDNLRKRKKTYVITVNSDIQFDIDDADLLPYDLHVEGNIKAVKLSVCNLNAYDINACTINSWGDVKAHNIDLIGCIKARNLDARNISAYAISVKEKIKTYSMNTEVSIKADSIKIGKYKTKHKTIDCY